MRSTWSSTSPTGRSFLRRKLVDAGSTVFLMALILVCLVLAFIGGGLAEDLLGYIGLGEGVSRIWNHAALARGRAGRDGACSPTSTT